MRIAHCIRALIAVLGFTAVFHQVYSQEHFNDTIYHSRTKRSSRVRHQSHWADLYDHNISLSEPGIFRSPKSNQKLLREEIKNRSAVDCCPSVLEMIEPAGGKNQEDQYVELYRDGDYKQRFYELSCHREILNKPCRFMDKKIHQHSKCVQKYSYTYALVKDPGGQRPKTFPRFPSAGPGGTGWTLDYIRVRSGCSCVVTPAPPRKKKRGKTHRLAEVSDDYHQ